VVAFIVAAQERNMGKAWALLGKEAQDYYNSLGQKQRRSGKGALENEIKRIKKFRAVKTDYTVVKDSVGVNTVIIITTGERFRIETINEDGNYKVRDGNSVRSLLKGITAELGEEGY
jgi:hypothetical protein